MTYVAAADFRLGTLKPHASNLVLGEADGTDAYLDLLIASVTTQVELDLSDDFEPANPDVDETITTSGNGVQTLYLPRRTRTLTTVRTRDLSGSWTTQTAYRLLSSLNAAGTAMLDGRHQDTLQILNGFTLGAWPTDTSSVELTGKFGWAAVPEDIKRLVALRVYNVVKAKADPLTTILQRTTVDAVITFGPSVEETEIIRRYRRDPVMAA